MHKKHGCWTFAIVTMLALAGCGVQEPDDGGAGGGSPPPSSSDDPGNGGTNGWENLGQDAGTGSADAPSPDAGSTPPAADGGAPADTVPDAGTPSSDAGSPAPDAGSPPADGGSDAGIAPMPAPVRSPSALQFRFADAYIGGTTCGQVRGNLPGTTWTSGPLMQDTNADHELEVAYTAIPAGTYLLTYVSSTCPGGAAVAETWANYGSRPQLLGMTGDARSFVNCNWWDAATGTAVTVESPGCNLRITVDASGVITGAGNMRNYH